MKPLPILLAITIAGVAAYYALSADPKGANRAKTQPVESLVLNQAGFYSETIEQITTGARPDKFRPSADKSLTDWLEASSDIATRHGSMATQELLERLSGDIPQISSATACIAFSTSTTELSESVAEWLDQVDPSFNHFATYVFADPSTQQIGCAALAVEKLPHFSPAAVNAGAKSFFSVCRLCDQSHLGTIEQTNGAAVLTCPHCDRAYELLAFKFDGKISRANELLTGWVPPVRFRNGLTRVEEMVAVWKSTLKHIRYAKDFEGIDGNLDTWQLAKETWKCKNGDCEDSSILLTDWLISRGFNARVAIGTTDQLEGHAWCVVLLEGTSYILETTEAEPSLKNLPYASSLQRHYIPKYQFNRDSVFYLTNSQQPSSYWSSTDWLQIDAE